MLIQYTKKHPQNNLTLIDKNTIFPDIEKVLKKKVEDKIHNCEISLSKDSKQLKTSFETDNKEMDNVVDTMRKEYPNVSITYYLATTPKTT